MIEEAYVRVDGRMVCETCGLEIWRHQAVDAATEMGEPVRFRRLCTGELGKT